MRTSDKRKYREGGFGVNVGTNLDAAVFYELEDIARKFGISRAGVVRELLNRGLAEYRLDGVLGPMPSMVHDQNVIGRHTYVRD